MRQGPRLLDTQRRTHDGTKRENTWHMSGAWESVDTEAGMLSGISRKRSIRSNPYWFTEFCNSQCLSHFAAPFIVVRAETSIAESCVSCEWWSKADHPETKSIDTNALHTNSDSFTAEVAETTPKLLHTPINK